jgi:hypothetical protein
MNRDHLLADIEVDVYRAPGEEETTSREIPITLWSVVDHRLTPFRFRLSQKQAELMVAHLVDAISRRREDRPWKR